MLRGVGHVHSTYSFDGKVPLDELAAFLRGKGLDFVLMTEHVEQMDAPSLSRFVDDCRALSTDDFLMLPGVEIEYSNVLAFGIDHVRQWDEPADLIPVFREQGAFLGLSHPAKLHRDAEVNAFPVVEGVEVWNRKYDGTKTLRPRSMALYEHLLGRKPGLVPTCGLDFHRLSDWTDVWMEVDAESPTRQQIFAALRAGAVRISAHGELIPIYADSAPTARAFYRLKSSACTAVLDTATFANNGLNRAGLELPRNVKQFVKKLF